MSGYRLPTCERQQHYYLQGKDCNLDLPMNQVRKPPHPADRRQIEQKQGGVALGWLARIIRGCHDAKTLMFRVCLTRDGTMQWYVHNKFC